MGKQAHILAVAAGHVPGTMAPPVGFTPLAGGLSNAIAGDAWFGPRPTLEDLKPVETGDGIGGILGAIVSGSGLKEAFGGLAEGDATIGGIAASIFGADEPRQAYPAFLQVIPYVLFRWRGTYLRYLRTTSGGDARLHGKISIGIGGHVDLNDAVAAQDGSIDVKATLDKAFRREAKEEIGLDLSQNGPTWAATLYAPETEVDAVHLGIVGIYDLSDVEKDQIKTEAEIGDARFATLQAVAAEAVDGITLETWTRLVIESNPLA